MTATEILTSVVSVISVIVSIMKDVKDSPDDKVVVLTQVLGDEVNIGYHPGTVRNHRRPVL